MEQALVHHRALQEGTQTTKAAALSIIASNSDVKHAVEDGEQWWKSVHFAAS